MPVNQSSVASNYKMSCGNVTTSNVIFATLKKGLDSFTDQISASQQFMSSKFDTILDDFAELCNEVRLLKRDNVELRKTVAQLERQLESHSCTVHRQGKLLDDFSRESVSCNAIVTGIPRVPHEETAKLIEKTFSVVSPHIDMKQVKHCERLSVTKSHHETPPIRVVFNNVDAKRKFVKAKIEYGRLRVGSITRCHGRADQVVSVRNELSPLKIELLNELKHSQHAIGFSYVWASTAGDILVRFNKSSKPIVIRTRADFHKLTSNQQSKQL